MHLFGWKECSQDLACLVALGDIHKGHSLCLKKPFNFSPYPHLQTPNTQHLILPDPSYYFLELPHYPPYPTLTPYYSLAPLSSLSYHYLPSHDLPQPYTHPLLTLPTRTHILPLKCTEVYSLQSCKSCQDFNESISANILKYILINLLIFLIKIAVLSNKLD